MVKPFSAMSVASAISQQNPAIVASAAELMKGSRKEEISKKAEGTLEEGFRTLSERKVEEAQAVREISTEELIDLLYSDPEKLIYGSLKFGGPYNDSIMLSTVITKG
ncbi:MAG: hypothetical protein QXL01_01805 [Thermoplasmatales archaeon]